MLTFGPKVQQTDFDTNIYQGRDPICAIRCQEMILRDYGIQIPKEELTAYATEQGTTELVPNPEMLEICLKHAMSGLILNIAILCMTLSMS